MAPRNAGQGYQGYADLADTLSGSPPDSPWAKWFGGIVAPFLIALAGVMFCITECAPFVPNECSGIETRGTTAFFTGLAWISVAFFLHFHYFWGNYARLEPFSDIGKVLSALAFIACLAYVCWTLLMS